MGDIPKSEVKKVLSPMCLLKKGERVHVLLDCGHVDKFTRTQIRTHSTYCFDCYYGKPVDPISLEMAEAV